MDFEAPRDMLFSDTAIPDIFICDIMPSLPSDCVKAYVYGLFLCKYKKKVTPDEFAMKLGLSRDALNAAMVFLENENLVVRTQKGYTFTDIKERELTRYYRRKEASTPEEALSNTQFNQRRNQCIQSMNQMFFQGSMSGDWYTFIDNLFNQHHFDEDVMISLFQYCYNRDALNKNYIGQVAASWAKRKITSHMELEKYMESFQKTRELSYRVAKALRLHRSLTVFEEDYVDIWANQFNFNMDVVEMALRKTTGKSNLNFKYIHSILSSWHKEGLKTKEEIITYCEKKKPSVKKEAAVSKVPQNNNFKQRRYTEEFYDKIKKSTFK